MAVGARERVDQKQEQLRQQANLGLHLLRASAHHFILHDLSNLSFENILRDQQNSMLLAHFQLLLLQSFILSTFDCRSRTDFTSGPHLHESTQGTDLLKLVPKAGEGHWHKCPGQGVQPRQLEKSGGNKEKNCTPGLDYLQIVQFHLGCNCQIDMRKAVSPLNSLKSTHDANFPRIYGSSPLEVIISACGGRGVLAEISQSLMSQS